MPRLSADSQDEQKIRDLLLQLKKQITNSPTFKDREFSICLTDTGDLVYKETLNLFYNVSVIFKIIVRHKEYKRECTLASCQSWVSGTSYSAVVTKVFTEVFGAS